MLFLSTAYVQSFFAELAANSTTSSTAFSDLLAITVNVGANHLVIMGAAGCSNTVGEQTSLGIAIDGVLQADCLVYINHATKTYGSGFTMALVDPNPGSRVISLQWKTSTGGTATCNPGQAMNATLLVYEVTKW
jgi:hypothetical protein